MNPLLKHLGPQANPVAPQQMAPVQTPLGQLRSVLQNGVSAQSLAENVLRQNPDAQPFINSLQNTKRNPKDLAMSLCQANGIPYEDMMFVAQMVGAR